MPDQTPIHASKQFRRRSAIHYLGWMLFVVTLTIAPIGCQLSPHMPDRSAGHFVPGSGGSQADDGWRRTNHGWEHSGSWQVRATLPAADSINTLLEKQSQREPAWIQQAMQILRGIPPQWIAVIQVLMIGVICTVSKRLQVAPKPIQGNDATSNASHLAVQMHHPILLPNHRSRIQYGD